MQWNFVSHTAWGRCVCWFCPLKVCSLLRLWVRQHQDSWLVDPGSLANKSTVAVWADAERSSSAIGLMKWRGVKRLPRFFSEAVSTLPWSPTFGLMCRNVPGSQVRSGLPSRLSHFLCICSPLTFYFPPLKGAKKKNTWFKIKCEWILSLSLPCSRKS